LIPGILIIRVEEPLYFANIEQIKEMFHRIEKLGSHLAHPSEKRTSLAPVKAVIVHAKNMQEVDPSAIQVFYEMLEDYNHREIVVCFVKLKTHLIASFKDAKIVNEKNEIRFMFQSTNDAVKYLEESSYKES